MDDDGARMLQAIGLPGDDPAVYGSDQRFGDGAAIRFEIPSVEGPRALEAVLEAARRARLPLHRISQGSGIEVLADREIHQMAALGRDAGVEISLFLSPRALYDTGAMHLAPGGAGVRNRVRGARQLGYALDELARAYELGIRSFLVTDIGLLAAIGELRQLGRLAADVRIKLSVMIGEANPSSARVLERLGATTFNVPTDLSVEHLASIRQACRMPLDVYIESPDDVGGFLRYHEMPRIAEVASPVYLKFGLRNAPGIYPSGLHLQAVAEATARERVHRLEVAWEALRRAGLGDRVSGVPVTADDLAIPRPA